MKTDISNVSLNKCSFVKCTFSTSLSMLDLKGPSELGALAVLYGLCRHQNLTEKAGDPFVR